MPWILVPYNMSAWDYTHFMKFKTLNVKFLCYYQMSLFWNCKKKWIRISKNKITVFKAVYVAFLPFDFNMHHHWL